MALRHQGELAKQARTGDILLVVHEFVARSPDELSLAKGDRIELIERDDDFGDGWYLGRHLQNNNTGLFPEVYTTSAPKAAQTARTASNKTKPQGLRAPPAPAASNIASTGESDEKTPSATETSASSYFESNKATSTPLAPPSPEPPAPPVLQAPNAAPSTTTETPAFSSRSPQQNSAVMNETLSVIDEHITNMNKPNRLDPNLSPMANIGSERRPSMVSHDSGSQYSNNTSQTRLAVGSETEEDEDGRLTEAEVSQWSPAKVAEYLEGVGVERAHCDLFRDEEFTGEVMLQMEQSQVFMKEFNLGPIGRRMRTWQKIKGLQDEVKMSRMGSSKPADTDQTKQSRSVTSPVLGSTPPVSGQTSPRPSAASIRSMGHRRHSSTEQASTSGPPRTKQSSFDRSWTMGGTSGAGLAPSLSTHSNGSRTVSSTHLHTASADRGPFEKLSRGSSQVSLPSQAEVDKGYSSGGEVDGKKTRNVLRKRDVSGDHSRTPSYSSEKRKSANYFWQKRATNSPVKPTENSELATVTHGDGVRIVSEPIQGNQTSPTVTRLEYDNEQPRSYRDSSSKMSPNEKKRASTASETTQSSNRRGLRTISDAITGREKSLVTSGEKFLPSDTSMTESPNRTSSTPSGTTPTLDYEDANKSEFATPAQGLTTSGTRRKSKKATSAYIRGLEKKSPQEQILGCDHSGWMKKKSSNLMTTWKPRFFVLRGRRLSYYYSDNDTEEKGLIDISNHRVLPADNDFLASMHAALTGANTASPTSPQSGTDPNTPSTPFVADGPSSANSASSAVTSPVFPANANESPTAGQSFLFKLVPPRSGLSRGVNFTRPSVHYFAVPNRTEGRAWMAALMKATIDRDETVKVITTYQQKTISLEQARARKERPPFLMNLGEEEKEPDTAAGAQERSLGGDTAVAENGSEGTGGGVADDKMSLPHINTDVEAKGGVKDVQSPNSGLGIQGLSASTGNESTSPTSAADRLKTSGLWS